MKNYAVITTGDRRIKEVVITIENQLKKGRYGSLENKRYSDCLYSEGRNALYFFRL